MDQSSYECKKCGATIKPSDTHCPNGHDLSKVGKKIKLTLREAISVSTRLESSLTTTSTKITEVQQSLHTSTLPPQARDEYSDKLDEIKSDVDSYQHHFEVLTNLLKDVHAQTKQKEGWEYWSEHLKGAIVGFIVGVILSRLLPI